MAWQRLPLASRIEAGHSASRVEAGHSTHTYVKLSVEIDKEKLQASKVLRPDHCATSYRASFSSTYSIPTLDKSRNSTCLSPNQSPIPKNPATPPLASPIPTSTPPSVKPHRPSQATLAMMRVRNLVARQRSIRRARSRRPQTSFTKRGSRTSTPSVRVGLEALERHGND